MKFRANVDGGPEITLHIPENGEAREGPSPMQATLVSAMACTAADIVYILRKQRASFEGLEIEGEAERATSEPQVFTKVRLHYKVYGNGLKDSAVRRAVELSTEKYCSVGTMLRRGGVAWENTWEILPPK